MIVEGGTKFGDIVKPTVPRFNKIGRRFTHIGWIENNISSVTNSICQGKNYVNDKSIINRDKTYYAVYTSEALKYTVKFSIWDEAKGNYVLCNEQIVEVGRTLGKLTQPTPLNSIKYNNKEYKYLGWSLTQPVNNGVVIDEDSILSSDYEVNDAITLYATYYGVNYANFYHLDTLSGSIKYSKCKEIVYPGKPTIGNLINNILPPESVITFEGRRYTFTHWSKVAPERGKVLLDTPELDTKEIVNSNINFMQYIHQNFLQFL